MPDLEKPKNIIFSPWGHENIYNGVAQPVWTPKRSKYLFSQNDQNAPSQPLVNQRSNNVKILIKNFSWFSIKLKLLEDI